MLRRITECTAQNELLTQFIETSVSFCKLIPLKMNLNQSCYAIVSYKIKCDFGNWPLCDITDINERIIETTSNFQGMSAVNESLLQTKEIVRIYADSKYRDRNIRWVVFCLAEFRKVPPLLICKAWFRMVFYAAFVCLFEWCFIRRFQQYFSHITVTAHIIRVFPGFHQ